MLLAGAMALALAAPQARAASDADLDAIRAQIRDLKSDYEARIKALEDRLKAAETQAAEAKKEAAEAAKAPPTPVAAAPAPPPPVAAGPSSPSSSLAAFNPAVSAILNGQYANLSQDPEKFRLAGFVGAPDAGPGKRGFSLGESELAFSANVDHKFSGNLIFSITPDDHVDVEEAYGIFTGAPAGFTPKFGRFFSGLGYLNEQHAHAWDFTDAPLVYQAFLNNQYQTNGLQLTWVAPTDQFFMLGGEVGSGETFPGTDRDKNGAGSGVVFARLGGDVGYSNSWIAGLSYLSTAARDRPTSQEDTFGNLLPFSFTGTSHVAAADFVWKWAPNGNPHTNNLKVQGEYLWRKESGDMFGSTGIGAPSSASYNSRQSGWYLQGVYQFMPQWRAGVRYDRLDSGTVDAGPFASFFTTSFDPQRATAMVDWSPSEFSRVRVQFAQAKLAPGLTDNEFFLQYILSIGAHGAHKF
jgi:hypothetical protein